MYNSKYLGEQVDNAVKNILGSKVLPRGTSSTAAAVADKTVKVGGSFTLEVGAMVVVHFLKTISVASATLSVNSTTAKAIYLDGNALAANVVSANDTLLLKYDGEVWNIIGVFEEGVDGETVHRFDVNGIAAVTTSPYYASKWSGVCPGIKNLYSGLTIQIRVPVLGNDRYGTVLNVNELGEHPVVLNSNETVGNHYSVGSLLVLIYDATRTASVYISGSNVAVMGCWVLTDVSVTPSKLGFGYVSCSTAAGTPSKVVSLPDYEMVENSIISVKFLNAITVASATLDVNSKGAKAIYHKGTALAADVVMERDVVVMQYADDKYQIIHIFRDAGVQEDDLSNTVKAGLGYPGKTLLELLKDGDIEFQLNDDGDILVVTN